MLVDGETTAELGHSFPHAGEHGFVARRIEHVGDEVRDLFGFEFAKAAVRRLADRHD